MQETTKVNYVQYEKSQPNQRKRSHNLVQGATSQGASGHKGAGGPQGIQTQWQIKQMTSSPT